MFRLVKAMVRLASDPHVPIGRKVVHLVYLLGGAFLTFICLSGSGILWLFVYFLLWPVIFLATDRSWREMPGLWKSVRSAPQPPPESTTAQAWDPVERAPQR